jgi:hypothetical protein
LEKVKDIEMSDESRKKIEGQAYFFRAFVYFNLIRSFGDVPYIDKPLNLTDVEDITRTPREEVYAKVMADFDKAIEYLPEEWDAALRVDHTWQYRRFLRGRGDPRVRGSDDFFERMRFPCRQGLRCEKHLQYGKNGL